MPQPSQTTVHQVCFLVLNTNLRSKKKNTEHLLKHRTYFLSFSGNCSTFSSTRNWLHDVIHLWHISWLNFFSN